MNAKLDMKMMVEMTVVMVVIIVIVAHVLATSTTYTVMGTLDRRAHVDTFAADAVSHSRVAA